MPAAQILPQLTVPDARGWHGVVALFGRVGSATDLESRAAAGRRRRAMLRLPGRTRSCVARCCCSAACGAGADRGVAALRAQRGPSFAHLPPARHAAHRRRDLRDDAAGQLGRPPSACALCGPCAEAVAISGPLPPTHPRVVIASPGSA
eukprot:scaffold2734_cov350-Prasinococcus_capsulatus_cf.AAC.1